MDDDKVVETDVQPNRKLIHQIDRIPQLVKVEDIYHMIDLQVATLDRLDCTNKSLANCSAMAQNKLATTTRLYKRTAKLISDSKRDLDVIYKKILDLKAKIRAERPDLFESKPASRAQDDHQDPEINEPNLDPCENEAGQ